MSSKAERRLDYTLERYLLGELPPDERAALEASPGFAERRRALEASNAELARRFPAARIVPELERRTRPRRAVWAMPALGGLVAAGLATVVFHHSPAPETVAYAPPAIHAPPPLTERLKGTPEPLALHVYRKTPTGFERLPDQADAAVRDLIQLGFRTPAAVFGCILSLDGRGRVTLHHPRRSVRSARLEPGREVLLPEAFELDDSPAFERFFLVTSAHEFSVQDVLRAAASVADPRSGRLPLGAAFDQSSVTLRKKSSL